MRVGPEGPLDARIMVLGEGPGKQEWRQGRPFVGSSGDLLNNVIRSSGIKRQDIYITNVIKNHLPPWGGGPPAQKAKKRRFFFEGKHPSAELMEGVLELMEEIRTVKPNVIIPMGNYALWAMMQHEGIQKWRGSILESNLVPGQKVVPCLHPAFYINARNMWHRLPLLEWDFARAVRESEFPELRLPEYDILTDPSPPQIEDAVEYYLQQDLITADTEWYGSNKLAYIGFASDDHRAVVIPNTSMQAIRAYRKILGSGIPIAMQNAAFDAVALHRQGIDVANIAEDTMIAWHCCWTDIRSKSLAMICSVLTDQPYYKDEVEFVGQDDEKGQIYCGTDCVVQHKAWEKIRDEEFETTGGRKGYDISMSAMPYFIKASNLGMLIDNELRIELKEAYTEKADEIEESLAQTLGYTINCRSSQQVIKLVHDFLLPTYQIARSKRTSKQEYLMDIAASCGIEAVELILGAIIRVRQNRNIVSRYLHDGIVDIDGRVRTNWNLAGTRSGRFSSTIPWWPGLAFQTVPRDARCIFIPDPGHTFMGFDYRQAEAYIVAMLTYNHELLEDLKNRVDIHTKLASQLFGIPEEKLLAEIAALEAQGKDKDECRPRFIGKKSRHAFNYVEGADTFRRSLNREWIDTGIGLTQTEARDIRSDYMKLNPGLEGWWKEVKQVLLSVGYIDNSFGRRRLALGRVTEDSHREMVSYEPQSTIGDYCTQAIVKVCKALPNAQVMLHMHDGALFQIPEGEAEAGYETMMELITWPIRVKNEYITIPADGKIGEHWT